MACDICTKTGTTLHELKEQYKTDRVQYICKDCLEETNNHLFALREVQRKMENRMMKRLLRYKRMYFKK